MPEHDFVAELYSPCSFFIRAERIPAEHLEHVGTFKVDPLEVLTFIETAEGTRVGRVREDVPGTAELYAELARHNAKLARGEPITDEDEKRLAELHAARQRERERLRQNRSG